MATSYSPKSATDGLVLMYDTGNGKSYKGEPTENLITDTAAFDSSFWNQKSGTITANSVTGPRGIQNAAKIVAVNTDPYIYSSAIVTASTGNVTWSIWVKGDGNTIGKSTQVRINFSGTATGTADTNASVNLTNNWQLLQTTANVTGAGTIKFGLEAPNSAVSGDVMYFADPMFEQKGHATPFTAGTRSATQGLIDLTGNSTIDLTNVSFDSNAQIVFDGTNDVITVPMGNLRPASAITQEVVVYIDNNTTQVWIGSQYGTSSGNSYALWLNGANTLSAGVNIGGSLNYQSQSYTITLNTYYHFVHTYDGTTQRIYANGVQIRQWTTTGNIEYNTNNTLLAIGNDWNGSGYNTGASLATHGKQDITKIYNRALTAEEVQNNFNGIRNRFGI